MKEVKIFDLLVESRKKDVQNIEKESKPHGDHVLDEVRSMVGMLGVVTKEI